MIRRSPIGDFLAIQWQPIHIDELAVPEGRRLPVIASEAHFDGLAFVRKVILHLRSPESKKHDAGKRACVANG